MTRSLVCLFLMASTSLLGGVAGDSPDSPGSPSRVNRAFAAIRSAWLIPDSTPDSPAGKPGMTLEAFAILGMVSHYSGQSPERILSKKKSRANWTSIIRDLGGELSDLVFQGNPRYPLSMILDEGTEKGSTFTEARILTLAEVLTLERFTGRGPKTILKKLRSGQSFQSMLAPDLQTPKMKKREGPSHRGAGVKGAFGDLGKGRGRGNHGEIGF